MTEAVSLECLVRGRVPFVWCGNRSLGAACSVFVGHGAKHPARDLHQRQYTAFPRLCARVSRTSVCGLWRQTWCFGG
jgi:hypothetical protein